MKLFWKTNTHSSSDVGKAGENEAAEYIKNVLGMDIKERNCHLSHREIDIIAEDDEYIVFFEVKTRSTVQDGDYPFGRPAAAVDRQKRAYLFSAARAYIRKTSADKIPRIDVIEIYYNEKDPAKRLVYIRNAVRGDNI